MPFVFVYSASAGAKALVAKMGCLFGLLMGPIIYLVDYLIQVVTWAQSKALLFALPLLLQSLRK